RVESLSDGEDLREDGEQDQLVSQQAEEPGYKQRVDVEPDSADPERTRYQKRRQDEPDREERQTWIEEQPTRAEQQHETEVSPAIAPRPQVRWTRAPIRMQHDRHLGYTHALE